MKFFAIDEDLEKLCRDKFVKTFVRLRIGDVWIDDFDILKCRFFSEKTSAGGVENRGWVVIDDEFFEYTKIAEREGWKSGTGVDVFFCFGEQKNAFLRFCLFADKEGFRFESRGCKRVLTVNLCDYSLFMKSIFNQRDWTNEKTFVHCKVCSNDDAENSLVHLLAKRCGFAPEDVECENIDLPVNYVKLRYSAWEELCELALCYGAHLECTFDKPLCFVKSPYREEWNFDLANEDAEDEAYSIEENDVFLWSEWEDAGYFANVLRVKFTEYVNITRQVIWNYDDSPAWYDENMRLVFPFADDSRFICRNGYKAYFKGEDTFGEVRSIIYAENVDDRETFERNLVYEPVTEGARLVVEDYNEKKYKNHAVLKLVPEGKLKLFRCLIYGSGIGEVPNVCCFLNDEESIRVHGMVCRDFTSRYFACINFEGLPFYVRRTRDLLDFYKYKKKRVRIKSFLALVNARVGACICYKGERLRIERIVFGYEKFGAVNTELVCIGHLQNGGVVNDG